MPITSLVQLQGVSCRFGADVAIEEIDLSLPAGDRVALLGPNGGGKSTLARLILGLLNPKRGTVVRRAGLRMGYVPQFPAFDRHFPVRVEEAAKGRTEPPVDPEHARHSDDGTRVSVVLPEKAP